MARQSRRKKSPQTRGRAARQQARAGKQKNSHLVMPYIERKIPAYNIATDADLEKIEQTTDTILAEIGIEFRDAPVTIQLFIDAGGTPTNVSDTATNIKFEAGLIRDIVKTAPERFTQHARNPKNSIEIGGTSTVFAPAYGSPFVMEMGEPRRYGNMKDFENFIKLAQSSPWLHHSGGTICEPTDVPVNKRHLDMVYAHMRYSDRPFLGSVTAPERAADSVEMCRVLFGADYVENHCVIMGNFNATSPLVWDGVSTESITEYAKAGQGSIVLPFLLGGAVAPVTTPGAIAQGLAEALVGCALTQLVRPGAPVILGSFLASMNMQSGSPTFGTPEPALGSLITGQMARRWKLPLRCAGNFATSKSPDGQAMAQGMMSMMSAVHCGANYILHSAGFLDGLLSMSYEKFMMDLDVCSALHTYMNGLEINDETLGLEALREGGPGAHMFGCTHTMRHFETAFWTSCLNDDQTYETWTEEGEIDAMQRANKKWKKVLEDYKAPPIDPEIDAALKAFIKNKKASMEDAWY
ncbi:MAG: trimethylamine methyltransferase family protein [Robiginitomaculum sp.]